jgi:SAM-dependent methyltransferase
MEYVRCNLCAGDETTLLFLAKDRDWNTGDSFRLVRCNRCGLVYINPRPDNEEMKKYYPPANWPRATANIDPDRAEIHWEPWRKIMELRAKPILIYKKRGKILDVGCGDGFFLKYMKELGWDVYGVEPGESASRYARDILGLNVFSGNLEESPYPDNFFDVINLYAVFEHLPNPSGALIKIRQILQDWGLLVITVPNFTGFESKIFRTRWVALKAPEHLYHFSPPTLKKIIEKANFKALKIKHISGERKCTMGYSESLRYILADHGYFPPKKYEAISQGEKCPSERKKVLWKEIIHFVERMCFKTMGHVASKFRQGGTLIVWAKKSL